MKVILEYEDGCYSLRAFGSNYDKADYVPPVQWEIDSRLTEIPDHVVAAYATLSAQNSTMQALLRRIENERD